MDERPFLSPCCATAKGTLTIFALAVAACGALAGCGGELGGGAGGDETAAAIGNGGPSGAHFDLNVIGVSNPLTQGNAGGSVIHVPLTGSCQINLAQGDFQVLDSNCTDGSAAFELPNPDPTNSGTTTYSVFVRALGKPGGSSSQTTCATDATGTLFCSIYSSVQLRTKGQQTFDNNGLRNLQMRFYPVSTTVP